MKILLLPSLYAPNIGGIETFAGEYAAELVKRGHSVTILTKKWPLSLPDNEIIDGVHVRRILSAKSEKEYQEMFKLLDQESEVLRSDVVHVIGVRRCLPLAAAHLSKLWNVPYFLTFAGSEVPEPNDSFSLSNWNENKGEIFSVVGDARGISAFSLALKSNVKKVMPSLSVDVLYAGIDLSVYKSGNSYVHPRPYIVSARRLSFDKGIDILIDAFNIVKKIEPVDLLIAGDGPEFQSLNNKVKELGISDSVFFLGSVTPEKLGELFREALLTVVPSRCEGGGLVNVQAQAAGCPVVATNVGGIAEYVNREASAILVSSEDVVSMASAIKRIIEDPILRKKMADGGRFFADKFEWDRIIGSYFDFYDRGRK